MAKPFASRDVISSPWYVCWVKACRRNVAHLIRSSIQNYMRDVLKTPLKGTNPAEVVPQDPYIAARTRTK